ncbi:hypothetical protein [Marinobacter sp. ELB17]|uniref:hypothetical protein n=1 Tax=Marinobacter sp. ELB17 TaxID=270374 RepID=UPI0000F38E8F|nr:hypothetical protein [Marinobacter sp. ELB17]EBA00983.1 hypothetical protein MELB17_18059 [Marinobacter sp. ELB17]
MWLKTNISEPLARGNTGAKESAMLKVIYIFFLTIACQTATAQQVDKSTKDYLIYASVMIKNLALDVPTEGNILPLTLNFDNGETISLGAKVTRTP